MSRKLERYFLLNPQWKPQVVRYQQRVGIMCPMEGWIIQLGSSQGPQELISC